METYQQIYLGGVLFIGLTSLAGHLLENKTLFYTGLAANVVTSGIGLLATVVTNEPLFSLGSLNLALHTVGWLLKRRPLDLHD